MELTDIVTQIQSLNQKYWYGHQSPKTCKLGSDGAGHDLIHPMDKLQAACRNGWSLANSALHTQEEIELKEVELEDMLRHVVPTDRVSELTQGGTRENKILTIKIRRCEREIIDLKLQFAERKLAAETYAEHATELLAVLSEKYAHFDDALEEIWACRIAYAAAVKNHPLGHELKIALMEESSKEKLMKAIGMGSFQDVHGREHPLLTPRADLIPEALEAALKGVNQGVREWPKVIGSSSEPVIQEPIPA